MNNIKVKNGDKINIDSKLLTVIIDGSNYCYLLSEIVRIVLSADNIMEDGSNIVLSIQTDSVLISISSDFGGFEKFMFDGICTFLNVDNSKIIYILSCTDKCSEVIYVK